VAEENCVYESPLDTVKVAVLNGRDGCVTLEVESGSIVDRYTCGAV
jgi:hypothetical protein